jgi:hypothetical protein
MRHIPRVDWPLVVNDRAKLDQAYAESTLYLHDHPVLRKRITEAMFALHEAGDLIPQTIEKAMSGHYFPYVLSYEEVENGYLLALCGFYRHALVALRTTLEFGVIGAYFAVDDREHITVRPWIRGEVRTPTFEVAVRALSRLHRFDAYDRQFQLVKTLRELYDELGAYTHIRGYARSHGALGLANFNAFSEQALVLWTGYLERVTRHVIAVMLIKYPLGLCGLPLDEKYGLNGPIGGFVQPHQVDIFKSVLRDKEAALLQELTDADPDVQSVRQQINDLPDLTFEEFEAQAAEFRKRWEAPVEPEDT